MSENAKTALLAVVIVGGGLYLWNRRRAQQDMIAAGYAPGSPQVLQAGIGGPLDARGGITNPISAVLSGVSSAITRIMASATSSPGGAPNDPAASASRTPTTAAPPSLGAAPPASPYGFVPVSPQLLLPNLGDPNQWWAATAPAIENQNASSMFSFLPSVNFANMFLTAAPTIPAPTRTVDVNGRTVGIYA